MRPPFAIAALLVGLLSVAAPAVEAGTPPVSVQTLTRRVEGRLAKWRAARDLRLQAQAEQSALAARVEALKAKARPGAADGELARLLRASVAAESKLAQALTDEADARAEVERAVRGGVGRIDREIRTLVPGLKTGALVERQQTAREINGLRETRKALRDALAALEDQTPAPRKEWAQYQVHIEPLDGPSELNEKADFVEDTRDKLKKKRLALARLLQEAKQEREIARAARDFDTYVRLFDEETRTDRVSRQNATALAATDRSTDGPEVSSPAPESPNYNGQPTTGVDSQVGGTPTPPTTDPGRGGELGQVDGDKLGSGQVPSPTVSTPSAEAGSVARDLNAELLINLRVDELAAQGLDMATLERLVEELEALDGYLDGQAKAIRQRAQNIEAEDAKTLGP